VVVAICSAVIALLLVATVAVDGTGEEGIRAAIRLTARTSVLLFTAAFTAGALRRRWPTPLTRWLLRRRRQVGLSFAVSHGLHLLAIVLLATRFPDTFWPNTSMVTIVFGGLAYVFILLMALTSNDASVRLLGGRRWSAVHTTGMYVIWTIFFVSYVPRALAMPAYVPAALLVVGGLAVRLVARRAAAPVLSDRQVAG
jgi:methionine sulfoxide reductase heme-binding subunit